jgi:cytidylate kinase
VEAAVRHITISGDLGSGKSSVAEALAGGLGFEIVSTGSIQRAIAASMAMSTLEANIAAESDASIDDRIDSVTVARAAEASAPIIFDSRMAWHFVPSALKVRLTVEPYAAAERILGRGPGAAESYDSVDETFDGVLLRAAAEVRRFASRYGVDIARLANFDLVLDTTGLTIAEAAARVAAAHAAPAEGGRRVEVCPRAIVPAFTLFRTSNPQADDGGPMDDGGPIQAVYSRPFFFAVGGEAALRAALAAGEGAVPLRVVAEGGEPTGCGLPASGLAEAVRGGAEFEAWGAEHGIPFRGLRRFAPS